jgi:hypothetical protein
VIRHGSCPLRQRALAPDRLVALFDAEKRILVFCSYKLVLHLRSGRTRFGFGSRLKNNRACKVIRPNQALSLEAVPTEDQRQQKTDNGRRERLHKGGEGRAQGLFVETAIDGSGAVYGGSSLMSTNDFKWPISTHGLE